jgi:hypothetical protein
MHQFLEPDEVADFAGAFIQYARQPGGIVSVLIDGDNQRLGAAKLERFFRQHVFGTLDQLGGI